jgi:hypothetical protein
MGYFCSDFANSEFVRWKSLISGIGQIPVLQWNYKSLNENPVSTFKRITVTGLQQKHGQIKYISIQ